MQVTRRQQLTAAQLGALFDPATEPRDMVRHYTFSDADLAMIRRCRGDHSRLGDALMLCLLRFPGRHLRAIAPDPFFELEVMLDLFAGVGSQIPLGESF